jgi:hypothetical protein
MYNKLQRVILVSSSLTFILDYFFCNVFLTFISGIRHYKKRDFTLKLLSTEGWMVNYFDFKVKVNNFINLTAIRSEINTITVYKEWKTRYSNEFYNKGWTQRKWTTLIKNYRKVILPRRKRNTPLES